ncbi:MAG: acetyl-CoA carboxylase carboxyltransferase subunit alpha [Candidatus Wallbacteria bacterium]|nr:acetyl-CoA carboxylase carboxyltransferase subunit alpha [Candidatus Wallbacteria bacterium]MBI4868074.1 acetyl-CoA carboxylase carboxyltransferase subunit alpha [Candidatus Wallbacteria bacterium]
MKELPFEHHLLELEKKIDELKSLSAAHFLDLSQEIDTLTQKLEKSKLETYSNLTPWQTTQLARHPRRPLCLDYIDMCFEDFVELRGGRQFPDDNSIVAGLALFRKEPVVVVGHQKGRDTKENIFRNFGMPHPEGYRKALRVMKLANKFRRPIITFVDTPGAYPGMEAEERGQAEAIARNIMEMTFLKVPIVVVVIGEGGSGGAVALGVGDSVLMLEHAIYSVISPEGCASILWRDPSKAEEAARALKLTARDLLELKVIDEFIEEPLGGAHRDPRTTAERVSSALARNLDRLKGLSAEELFQRRLEKYRRMGVYSEDLQ